METLVIRGLLAGFLAGLSIGPVAIWGAQLRSEKYRDAFAIMAGASAGNIFVGGYLLALAIILEVSLADIHAVLGQLTVPSLLLAGAALLWMASHRPTANSWSRGRRFVTAFAVSAFWPGTPAFTAYWLIQQWGASDNPWWFFCFFGAGVIAAWLWNIEFFYRWGSWAPAVIRVAGAGCLVAACIKLA